jgi:hypothetical protein
VRNFILSRSLSPVSRVSKSRGHLYNIAGVSHAARGSNQTDAFASQWRAPNPVRKKFLLRTAKVQNGTKKEGGHESLG